MEEWRKVGMELVRDGWEPLFMYLLLLLHPAVCRYRGTLTDLKGDTSRGVTKDGELGG